jgi:tetratricopeptide (TPR) repeat protein
VRDELLDVLANLSWYQRRRDQAEALYLERIESIKLHFGAANPRQAEPLLDLSHLLRKAGRFDESIERAQQAIAILEAAGQQDSFMGGRALMEAAMARYLKNNRKSTTVYAELQESIRVMEKFPAAPELASAYLSLGNAYEVERRFDESIAANRRGLELAIRTSAHLSDLVAGAHLQLARAYAGVFRFAEAEEQYAKAIEVATFVAGVRGQTTLESRTHMANMMTSRGKYRAAVKEMDAVLPLQLEGNEPEGIPHKNTRYVLGRSLAAIGDFDRARVQLDAAEATSNRLADKRGLPVILHARAEIALDEQRPAEALKDVDLAAAIIASLQGPKSLTAARNLLTRGETLVALRRFGEARAALENAAAVFAETERDPVRGGTLQTRLAMASIDLAQGQTEAARKETAAVLERLAGSNRRADLWILEERAYRQLAAVQLESGQMPEACKSLDLAIALREANALPTDPRLAAARKLKTGCAS